LFFEQAGISITFKKVKKDSDGRLQVLKTVKLGIIKIVIMKRNATAVWNGSKEGAGKLTTQSTT
jgi:hypothetical protein